MLRNPLDRRSFLRIAGTSLSIGALYSAFAPLAHGAGGAILTRTLAELNGEAPGAFSFLQLSDTHVGSTDRRIRSAPGPLKMRLPPSIGLSGGLSW